MATDAEIQAVQNRLDDIDAQLAAYTGGVEEWEDSHGNRIKRTPQVELRKQRASVAAELSSLSASPTGPIRLGRTYG